ncbi:hypothetical protein [Rheinheimera gaetbuli]
MSHQVKVSKNNQIQLPNNLCIELGINLGDILFCELAEDSSKIVMTKHIDQSLGDAEIESAGNLTRVIPFEPD